MHEPSAAAPWEITGAVAWAASKTLNNRRLTVDLWKQTRTTLKWFATPADWFNRWNRHDFGQGFCGTGSVLYSENGSELWVWKTSTRMLTRVDAPWEYGCR